MSFSVIPVPNTDLVHVLSDQDNQIVIGTANPDILRQDAGTERQGVYVTRVTTIIDDIEAVTRVENITVIPRTAAQQVVSGIAVQGVVAGPAV